MRLKDANIAKIENIDLVVQAEYLSNKRACTDQATQKEKRDRTIENIMEGGEYEPS